MTKAMIAEALGTCNIKTLLKRRGSKLEGMMDKGPKLGEETIEAEGAADAEWVIETCHSGPGR